MGVSYVLRIVVFYYDALGTLDPSRVTAHARDISLLMAQLASVVALPIVSSWVTKVRRLRPHLQGVGAAGRACPRRRLARIAHLDRPASVLAGVPCLRTALSGARLLADTWHCAMTFPVRRGPLRGAI